MPPNRKIWLTCQDWVFGEKGLNSLLSRTLLSRSKEGSNSKMFKCKLMCVFRGVGAMELVAMDMKVNCKVF